MTPKAPDAVRSPVAYSGVGSASARLVKLHVEFAPLLRQPRIFVRLQGSEHFITGNPADTLLFSRDSDRPGTARYDWCDRGDGILFGVLK